METYLYRAGARLRLVAWLFFFIIATPLARAAGHYPIVFAHGFGVPAELYEKVVPLKKVARELGYELYVAHTPTGQSVKERARILNDEIKRLVPSGPFHIIAHSMGGLDARLAIHKYGLGSRCLSLTTLSTPHHGSAIADYVIEILDAGSEKSGFVEKILKLVDGSVQAVRDLTTASVEGVFNGNFEDDARVRYFSMAFYIPDPAPLHSMVPLLWVANKIIAQRGDKENDGMVSVESAKWGEFLGTYPGDHWAETAQVPFWGGPSYKEVFATIVRNLDRKF